MNDFFSTNRQDFRGVDFDKANDEAALNEHVSSNSCSGRQQQSRTDAAVEHQIRLVTDAHSLSLIPLVVTAKPRKLKRACPWLRLVKVGDKGPSAAAINPFEILNGVDIRKHIEQLSIIFGGLFSFTHEVATLFKCSLQLAYQNRGWNLLTGNNWRSGQTDSYNAELYPDFVDLPQVLEEAANLSDLPPFAAVNAEGVLRALIREMTSGLAANAFARRTTVSINQLLLEGTIVDVSLVGEAKRGRSLTESLLLLFFTEIYGDDEKDSPDRALLLIDFDDLSLPTFQIRQEEASWFFAKSNKCLDNGSPVLTMGNGENGDLQVLNEIANTHSDTGSSSICRKSPKPFSIPQFISYGQSYYPDAFAPEVFEVGSRIADDWQFRDTFVRYLLQIDSDYTGLVHGRGDLIREVQRLTLRNPVLLPAVTWCALSLVTDRYFAQRATFYAWTTEQEDQLRTGWYEMINQAFVPGSSRRIDLSKIKTWQRSLADVSKVEQGPLVVCGPCTRKCAFGFDVKLLLSNDKILFDYNSSLRATKQSSVKKAAWFTHLVAERLAGGNSAVDHLDLSYCLTAHLSDRQQYSTDAHLAFCHKVRDLLEAGDVSIEEDPSTEESAVTVKSVAAGS